MPGLTMRRGMGWRQAMGVLHRASLLGLSLRLIGLSLSRYEFISPPGVVLLSFFHSRQKTDFDRVGWLLCDLSKVVVTIVAQESW